MPVDIDHMTYSYIYIYIQCQYIYTLWCIYIYICFDPLSHILHSAQLGKERGVHRICAPKTALSITQLLQNKRLVKSGWKKGSHRIHLLPGRHHGYVLYMFGFQPSDLSAGV